MREAGTEETANESGGETRMRRPDDARPAEQSSADTITSISVSTRELSDTAVLPPAVADAIAALPGSGERPDAAAISPRSLFLDAEVVLLYSASPRGRAAASVDPEIETTLDTVTQFVAFLADNETELAVSNRDEWFVRRALAEMTDEIGAIERVYRGAVDATTVDLIVKDGDDRWWLVAITVDAGELIDVEYREVNRVD